MIFHKITLLQKGKSVGECLLTVSDSIGTFPGITPVDNRLGTRILEGYLRAERLIFNRMEEPPCVVFAWRNVIWANMFVSYLLGEKLPLLPSEQTEYSKKIELGEVRVQVIATVDESDESEETDSGGPEIVV